MKNETSSSTFQQQQKDAITPTLAEHAERFEARIQEVLGQSQNGILEAKERYEPVDFSEVANDIWEALNNIDDSPIAKIIHGAVYGVSEKAVEIFSTMYEVFEKRLGETLTTTVNDLDGFNSLIDGVVSEIQRDLDNGTFSQSWQQEIPDGFSLRDYLLAGSQSESAPQAQEQTSGLER
ncbi:MAG: hypothetical protein SV765_00235 [Pseudomonadota bacterium]|nr:hypothetical protein [Pseudomonadota bacterium]